MDRKVKEPGFRLSYTVSQSPKGVWWMRWYVERLGDAAGPIAHGTREEMEELFKGVVGAVDWRQHAATWAQDREARIEREREEARIAALPLRLRLFAEGG